VFQQHVFLARLALALELRVNPTKPKLSRQACSELRGQTWKQESEAGGIENTGSVLSPENGIVVVFRIIRYLVSSIWESRRFRAYGRQQSWLCYKLWV